MYFSTILLLLASLLQVRGKDCNSASASELECQKPKSAGTMLLQRNANAADSFKDEEVAEAVETETQTEAEEAEKQSVLLDDEVLVETRRRRGVLLPYNNSNAMALVNECADAECYLKTVGCQTCEYYKSGGHCAKAKSWQDGAQIWVTSSMLKARTFCRATCGLCEMGQAKDVVSGKKLRNRFDGKCVQYNGQQLSMAECDGKETQLWSSTNVGPKVGAQYLHLKADATKKAKQQRFLTFVRKDANKFGNCRDAGDAGCAVSMSKNKETCSQQWLFVGEQIRSEVQKGYGNGWPRLVFGSANFEDCMQAMDDGSLRFKSCTMDDDRQRFYFE